MSVQLRLPDLGEGIDEVDVLLVLVEIGQTVAAGDSVIEIESDKATLEIPVDVGGRVESVHVKRGETIAVGQPLLTIDPAEAPGQGLPAMDKAHTGIGMDDDGSPDDVGADIEGQEALAQEPAGDVFGHPRGEQAVVSGDPKALPVPAAPSVRTFAREIGMDVRQVSGSGPGGRISIDDVKAHSRTRTAAASVQREMQLPDFEQWGPVSRTRISRLRRTIAQNLAHSWATVPHVTLFSEADVTDVELLRQQHKDRAKARGAKVTITTLLLPIIAAALKAHPKLNTSLDLTAGEIVQKRYYHIGLAADTDRGLLVPVVRDVDQKDVIDLAVEMADLAQRARTGELAADEMQGATFTLSNLGGLGGTGFFTPIINWPEVGVLGVGRSVSRPIVRDGTPLQTEARVVRERLIMPLSLSFDHRALDGADGARFLSYIVEALEQPRIHEHLDDGRIGRSG